MKHFILVLNYTNLVGRVGTARPNLVLDSVDMN